MRQNGFTSLIVIASVLVIVGVGGAFYYLTQVQNKESKPVVTSTQVTSSPTSIPLVNQEQQKKFQSVQYKFSLAYPVNWNYKENDPFVPNLAEYTTTFSAPDGNSVLDVWIRSGNWADVERDILKEKNTTKTTLAEQPAIIQLLGNNGKVTFVKHPTITDRVLVFTSSGENLDVADQIQKTLKFD